MTAALLDVPRCLNVETSYVGSPRALVVAQGGQRTVWANAVPAGGTAAYRRQAVLECLDTAALLRAYREPLEGETWLTPAASERRLLAQLNAIIALGAASLAQVAALSLDPDVPDPGRVFAALLVLGCVEGVEWLAPACDIFIAAVLRTPAEAAAAVEAFCLCPHPELAAVVAPLRAHRAPRVRAASIRVLAYRRALTEGAWNDAIKDADPTVVAAAACAPLGDYKRDICERALQPLFVQRDGEALARLALRAGLSLRLQTAHQSAAQIVHTDRPAWADAANCLAMFGHLADASYIREALRGLRPQDAIGAATILGSIELVPDLLDLLHRNDVTPDGGMQIRQALAAITGVAFDGTADAAQARRLWSQHAPRFDQRLRYRRGRPWSLDALFDSLRAGENARDARQNVYLELLAATESRAPRFSAYDFVGIQLESLSRIESWLADARGRRFDMPSLH